MLTGMDQSRRDRARATAVEVLNTLRDHIAADAGINVTKVARAAGVAPSTFYRWLENPPEKVDSIAIAAIADYLHEAHGHEDFATLWRRVEKRQREVQ